MRGIPRPEVGAKIAATVTGRKYGPRPPEWKASISDGLRAFWSSQEASRRERDARRARARDPHWQFQRTVDRWGERKDSARRAATKLRDTLRRPRGGRPAKLALHERWRAMYEGRDAELEELLADDSLSRDGLSRIRAVAFLDWQRHPDDWPRDRYPSSRHDADEIDRSFLRPAEDRVRKGLKKALQSV